MILWKIAHGTVTYNALRREVMGVTDKMLSTELLALANAGLVTRVELSVTPRRTRYELTARGTGLIPVLEAMEAWCAANSISGNIEPEREG